MRKVHGSSGLFSFVEGRAHHQNLAVRELFSKEPPQKKSWEIKLAKITVGTKVIADFFGVTERTIRRWVQKGMPRVDDAVFSPRDCFNWWNEYINDAGEDDSNKDAKEIYWEAKAGNERLKFEKTKGKLVARDEVEKCFAGRAYELSLSFRALKNRLPPVLEGKSREEMQNELSKELNRILEAYKRAGNFIPEGLNNILLELAEEEIEFVNKLKKTKTKAKAKTKTTKKSAVKRGKK